MADINKVCKQVLKIEDADFDEMTAIASGQAEYVHPLKCATAAKQNKLGRYNLRVLSLLRELRDTINAGPEGIEP